MRGFPIKKRKWLTKVLAWKKGRENSPALSFGMSRQARETLLQFLDVYRLRSLGAFFDLKGHFLAFTEGPEARTFNGAVVHKNIRPVARFNKTITFLIVEPFNPTFRHCPILS